MAGEMVWVIQPTEAPCMVVTLVPQGRRYRERLDRWRERVLARLLESNPEWREYPRALLARDDLPPYDERRNRWRLVDGAVVVIEEAE